MQLRKGSKCVFFSQGFTPLNLTAHNTLSQLLGQPGNVNVHRETVRWGKTAGELKSFSRDYDLVQWNVCKHGLRSQAAWGQILLLPGCVALGGLLNLSVP